MSLLIFEEGEHMNTFTRSLDRIFSGIYRALRTFPVSIGCAFAFAIVTAVRIQLDWPQQEPFNFMFNCLHWAFALGALFGLTAITAAYSRFSSARSFLTANLLGAAATAVTFWGLYLYGGTEQTSSGYAEISALAAARVSAAMLVLMILFVIVAADPKDRSGFANSLFMTHKAFFIALIYGLVILAGTTGVARGVQGLLYRNMSSKVYLYIATAVGFLTYTLFVGYFPDFRKGNDDEHRDAAQKQPKFIEILFGYILVPIVLALTVVLLIWAIQTVLNGMRVSFVRLSTISASYTIGGLWLHAMVTQHDSGLAKLYRQVYPIASIVILVFEAWAVRNQLQSSGLKLTEYIFILIWILAATGDVLLLIRKSRAHRTIAVTACALAVFSVLPAVGYYALPVRLQANRLETLLVGEGMLSGDQITPAASEPDQPVREAITDAVNYLANARDAKYPTWFEKGFARSDVFLETFGFAMTWAKSDGDIGDQPTKTLGTYLSLPPGALDISGYTWAVNPQSEFEKGGGNTSVSGDRGTYQIEWTVSDRGIPSIKILLDDRVLLQQDLKKYIGIICKKYPPGYSGYPGVTLEDMSFPIQTAEINILLVFDYIEINVDPTNDTIQYWLSLREMYLAENP